MANLTTSAGQTRFDFDNGVTLSIVNRAGTYSDNHDSSAWDADSYSGNTVEIAAWFTNRTTSRWILDQDVEGYISVSDLPQIIQFFSSNASRHTDMMRSHALTMSDVLDTRIEA